MDNGGNFVIILTGFGGFDFIEFSRVALLDSGFMNFDFSDAKFFLITLLDFKVNSFNF